MTLTSPADCIDAIGKAHRDRDYTALAALMEPGDGGATIEFIKAVDEVLAANERVRSTAIRRYGRVLADAWDVSAMSNNLGVFSADRRIIAQRFRGDVAEVTLQQGEQVPLIRVTLRRGDGAWRLVPDPVSPVVAPQLHELADEMSRLAADIEDGADYLDYLRAFPDRIAPRMARVMTAGEDMRLSAGEASDESP